MGLGTAYITGFRWALEKNYDYILEMDADFSHPPAKLNELLEKCETGQSDLAVGSRYVKGGGVVNAINHWNGHQRSYSRFCVL